MRISAALLGMLLVCACGPTTGDISVQIVVPLDEKMSQFGLKVVKLPNLLDITQLKGEKFVFTGGINVPWDIYSQTQEEISFESARASLLHKIPLTPVNLKLTWNGDFYKAADFDTLYMLTAYYQLERTSDFFVNVIGDTSSATKKPVAVSVYGSFTSRGYVRIPSGYMDNSAYRPLEDIFKMYRVADQEGLPFEMNPGVVAHEFQHRVFHDLVFQSKGDVGFKTWKIFSGSEISSKYTRARVLLRATDEGLADIFGVGFTKNSNFFAASIFPNESKISEGQRDLQGEFASAATYDDLADSNLKSKFIALCNGESLNYSNPNWRYYCLGTVIARTLWEAADRNPDVLRKEILPFVNHSLSGIGDEIVNNFEKYDLDVLWTGILKKLSTQRALKLCEQIKIRFRSLYDKVEQCK